jgi:hypothetical protein
MSALQKVLDTLVARMAVPGYAEAGYRLRHRRRAPLSPGAMAGPMP